MFRFFYNKIYSYYFQEEQNNLNATKEYIPGDIVDEKNRIENPEIEELDLTKLVEPDENQLRDEEEIHSKGGEEIALKDQLNTMKNGNGFLHRKRLPIVDPFSGFYYARKMHMDNLLHQPLPDTMGPRDTRRGPGQDLDVKPYSTALNIIGERPLTCTGVKKYSTRINKLDPSRPATSGGEKGNIKQNMTPMDLAICWDFRTANPRDEPKRPKHIDGSNGSLAPAVFSMVHTPIKNADAPVETGRSNAIFSQNILPHDFENDRIIPSFEKDMSKNRNKNACDVPKCPQHSMYENNKKHKNNSQENLIEKHERGKSGLNKNECDGIHGCGTDSNSSKLSNNSKSSNPKRKHIKNAWEDNGNDSKAINNSKIIQKNIEKYGMRERAGSLDHLNNNSDTSTRSLNEKNKMCRSSPNIHKEESDQFKEDVLSPCSEICMKNGKKQKPRNCVACKENKKKTSNPLIKNEYKAAFKAGNPNSVSSDSKNEYSSNSTKNSVKIPKMRDPFSKKSYAIPTLHPPFNRWNDTSGYPEHWRLASVYQHAYKPPNPKRRPLLPAVYQ